MVKMWILLLAVITVIIKTPLTYFVCSVEDTCCCSKRTLVDAFFNLGMCVSYNHLFQLTFDLGNGVCDQFALDGALCPTKMCRRLFTMAAADNTDYNSKAATAKDSFWNFSHAASLS